jgi:putative SOS response-associated peptidase YedK
MCGRYAITTAPEAIRRLFGYLEQPNFPPRYNVAPTQPIPIVRLAGGKREYALMRWGLIPAWVKDPRGFSLLINARGESVLDKPAFRNAMKRRRCLIPADGFYEWKDEGKFRRPFYIRPTTGEPMALAGLWETWTGPNGEEMDTAVIVTTQANRMLLALHDRMPVVVLPEAFDSWLDCAKVDALSATALIAPAPDAALEMHEVSAAVNKAANDTPDLIEPATNAAEPAVPPASSAKRRAKADDGQASLF